MDRAQLPKKCLACDDLVGCKVLSLEPGTSDYVSFMGKEELKSYVQEVGKDKVDELVSRTLIVRAHLAAKALGEGIIEYADEIKVYSDSVLMLGYMFGQGKADMQYFPKVEDITDLPKQSEEEAKIQELRDLLEKLKAELMGINQN